MEVWGAQGRAYAQGIGGKGGYSIGYYYGNGLLYVCVGAVTGYNGGNNGGMSGGGATHIAMTNDRGILANYVNNKNEVLIVAGGGGGSNDIGNGGAGGGLNGGAGEQVVFGTITIKGGTGGTQSSGGTFTGNISGQTVVNGSFGKGGHAIDAKNDPGGDGGGGWYGGGGTPYSGCGGGGSGYIGGVSNGSTTSGVQSGHGKALITWMPLL